MIKERLNIKSSSGIDWRCVTIEDEDVYVHIYFQRSLEKPELFTSDNKLLEESKHQNWGKGINVRFDRDNYGLNDPNKDHLHIYKKGRQLFAINRDGTGHDNFGQVQIPNRIAKKIKQEYPDFEIPSNNILESIDSNLLEEIKEILYLLERQ